MFVDASALTAILVGEPEAAELAGKLQDTDSRFTSPLVVWETTTAVTRILGLPVATATRGVLDYLELASIALLAIPVEATSIALDAFDRYGKGRHPAKLNFGDCFAYACAKHFNLPLLFKGEDFTRTDIARA